MKILKEINDIIHISFEHSQREHGGIIGGFDDIITAFEFDKGLCSENMGCYIPNVELLNYCIQKWQSKDIHFYGIVHNHLTEYTYLSNDDIKYIEKIMVSMPPNINKLYFPIMSSKNILHAFKVTRMNEDISVVSDNITIIQ